MILVILASGMGTRLNKKMPNYMLVTGRPFKYGHSSGPMGETTSGNWESYDSTLDDWKNTAYEKSGWFDLHAKRD